MSTFLCKEFQIKKNGSTRSLELVLAFTFHGSRFNVHYFVKFERNKKSLYSKTVLSGVWFIEVIVCKNTMQLKCMILRHIFIILFIKLLA